ncbi:hypothetical protein [Clostridium ganghwense]|uniref:Hydrogenase maturation nickel metallochaperone HypA n=1 Tax=Clostridium ganghwense TaxID=312089 RepID=A0ABT4CSY0_9CLOT|nr:hypothetical protein [Clostridium ganghwense]MCY6372033.1 hypothetical protein [Clostridium ganghwense]
MHDSFLMQNISKSLNNICMDNGIKKITSMEISVNFNSHINEENLLEHLIDMNKGFVDKYTKVKVVFGDMPELTATIRKVEGEKK